MSQHLTKQDVQRYGLDGDPDFNPSRNEWIIAKAIKDTDKAYKAKRKMVEEGLAERVELVSNYIHHILNKKEMDITEYAGWEQTRRMVGEGRLQRLQELYRLRHGK